MKKTIKIKLTEYFTLFDLEGPVDETIQRLSNIKKDWDSYDSFELREESSYWGEDGSLLSVYGVRLETDKEFEKRIAKDKKEKEQEKKRKEGAKKAERTLYERLKKKYEKEPK